MLKAGSAQYAHGAPGAAISRDRSEPAGQSRVASRRRVLMFVIVPAAVARLARDSRSQQHAIVLVIGLAAAARLARHGQAGLLSRLAAWDKRRNVRHLRSVKGGQA